MCKNRDVTPKELFEEFIFEDKRADGYFDRMYRIFQFTFALLVSLLVFALGLNLPDEYRNVTLQYILPISLYVFGIMYAYNAYALAMCGKRAEILHQAIYKDTNLDIFDDDLKTQLSNYVITDRKVTMISYGLALGFYYTIPILSVFVGMHFTYMYEHILYKILPYVFYGIYFILESIVVANIINPHWSIPKIQKKTQC